MSHIIQQFGLWRKINEQETPSKARQTNKIVVIPIDEYSLKIKLVNYPGMIVDGRLTPQGFDSIIAWIMGQNEIIDYYIALKDLNRNVVVYEISKDSSRADIILFRIYDKTNLSAQNPYSPGIPAKVKFIRKDEVQSAIRGIMTDGKPQSGTAPSGETKSETPKMRLPFPSASIQGSRDAALRGLIISAYNKLYKDGALANSPILTKVKEEVQSNQLGKSTILLIKALNAGFGIQDDEFSEDVESDITQALYSKIQSSEEFAKINADAFLKVVASQVSTLTTGDIKVPAEGFKYGVKGDLELQKFQDILLKNLPIYLGGAIKGKSPVAAFLRTKADGIYGNGTKNLIGYLKAGLTDPKYPDNDATVIKPDFVNRMMKEFKLIKESKTYLGLDGVTLIIEGFDTGAADLVVGGSRGSGGGSRGSGDRSGASSSGIVHLTSNTMWEYTLKDSVWHYRKSKSSDSWKLLTNPNSIKELHKTHNIFGKYPRIKKEDGKYIRNTDRLYDYKDGKWLVLLDGKWLELQDNNIADELSRYYKPEIEFKGTGSATGELTSQIDSAFISLGSDIENFIEQKGKYKKEKPFGAYTEWNDNEEDAWDEVVMPKWKTVWKKEANRIIGIVNSNNDKFTESDKARYTKSFNRIKDMFELESNWSDNFKNKFGGGTSSDTFELILTLSGSKVKRFKINTDFE
jgi:hypothetical protein